MAPEPPACAVVVERIGDPSIPIDRLINGMDGSPIRPALVAERVWNRVPSPARFLDEARDRSASTEAGDRSPPRDGSG